MSGATQNVKAVAIPTNPEDESSRNRFDKFIIQSAMMLLEFEWRPYLEQSTITRK
jgi:hypothetical protein